jgi:hypothetical protein
MRVADRSVFAGAAVALVVESAGAGLVMALVLGLLVVAALGWFR